MASKSDLAIDSVDSESGGYQRDEEFNHQHQQPFVCIVNSNYNPEEESEDNFDEIDLPTHIASAGDAKEEPFAETLDSHLAAKKFESQYKHQHQTYSMCPKKLRTFI